jgi:competence protein ComEC
MTGAFATGAPAFRVCVLVMAGILVAFVFPSLKLWCSFLCASACILALLLVCRSRQSAWIVVAAIAVAFFAGGTKMSVDRERTFVIPDSLRAARHCVVGSIAEQPSVEGHRTRFLLHARSLSDGKTTVPCDATILVALLRTTRDTTPVSYDYGMTVALAGMLNRPPAERNPGEFDARRYYEANGISLFMTVRGNYDAAVLDSSGGAWFWRHIVIPVRGAVLSTIDRTVGGEEGAFLAGLLLGERSGMSPSVRTAFVDSGVAHVLAVSGSNVVVVAAVFYVIFGLLRLPRMVILLGTAAGLVLYMFVTGVQPPVVRATIMALAVMAGGAFQRRSNVYNSLGLAALILLALDARQLFDIGFELSFGAVLSIVYFTPKANAWIARIPHRGRIGRAFQWVLRVCAVSLFATLGTLPLTAVSFGKVSLIGILANILVIPASGLSVVLGFVTFLAGMFGAWVAGCYAAFNWVVLRGTILVATTAAAMPLATVDTTRFSLIDALPFYAALLLVFRSAWDGATRRLVIVFLVTLTIAVFAPRSSAYTPSAGRLRISFIDVGEGDAVLLELPAGKRVLIDAGPRSETFDAGERVVVPFLRRRGIEALDLLVVSHLHADHLGGVAAVLREIPVRAVLHPPAAGASLMGEEFLRDVRLRGCADMPPHGVPLADSAGFRMYVLAPLPRDTVSASAAARGPNASVVLKLQYGAMSALFMGDAERDEELTLVERYGEFLRSSLLKVAHHGSNTSSSVELLESVRPSVAVISVGRNNKFRHPSFDVLQRLDALEAMVVRTDEEGALLFESDGNSLTRLEWR